MDRWAREIFSTVPICISDETGHSNDPDQVLSVNDLPPDNHVDLVLPNHFCRRIRLQRPCCSIGGFFCSDFSESCMVRLTPDVLDAEPVFEVSPHTTGFMLRTRDNALPTSPVGLPIQLGSESDLPLSWGNQWPSTSAGRSRARMPRP